MTGEEIARELINSLSVQYSVGSNLVVALTHDRTACNGVAVRTLKIVPWLMWGASLDLVRDKFCTPHLITIQRVG